MKAVVYHGKKDLSVDTVDEPTIQEPTDAVIRVTATAICGSDLHLYEKMSAAMEDGDIIGHEPMGVVEAVGSEVKNIAVGDTVVIPFQIACGHCFMCDHDLQTQCETTQNEDTGKGASLFGYTHLYGGIPGGQAQFLRVPQAHYGPIKVPEGAPNQDGLLLLSDVLPTAWQGVEYADIPEGGTVAIFGLGPIGQMASRVALHRGAGRVIGIDAVAERREMAQRHGAETIDPEACDDVVAEIRSRTNGRGADSVIDAVGMEADGSVLEAALQKVGVPIDRTHALRNAWDSVRRGGTLSLSGVYVGYVNMFNLGDLFDRQVTLKMGQANVKRWVDDIMPLVLDDADPLGTRDLVTHRVPLARAPEMYETFQKKQDGCIKVVLDPWA